RLLCAERFVLAWPKLFEGALESAELALRADGRLLIALARFEASKLTDAQRAIFGLWSERSGGTEIAVSALDLRERGNFLARFEQCEHRVQGIAPPGLAQAFDALLALAGVSRVHHQAGAP